jgi:hypothetical protein
MMRGDTVVYEDMTEFAALGPGWEHSPENQEKTELLLSSDSELDNAYGEVYSHRCFVVELKYGELEFVGVGELDAITLAERLFGAEIDIRRDIGIQECMELGVIPGRGGTRPERIRDGLRQVLEARTGR